MRGTGRETRKELHESDGSPRCFTGKGGGNRDEHKILTNILIQSGKCNNGYFTEPEKTATLNPVGDIGSAGPLLRPPHTYTANDVALPRGSSGLAGKASEREEGVAACTLARSEQNIPAMWLIPSLDPPQRCFFFPFFFSFLFKAELKHSQQRDGEDSPQHISSRRGNKTSVRVHRAILKPATLTFRRRSSSTTEAARHKRRAA